MAGYHYSPHFLVGNGADMFHESDIILSVVCKFIAFVFNS